MKYIVGIDDDPVNIHNYIGTATSYLSDEIRFVPFTNSHDAKVFFDNNANNIIGCIQDLNRIEELPTSYPNEPAGLYFLENVIGRTAPNIKVAIVTGHSGVGEIVKIYENQSKTKLLFKPVSHLELKEIFEWLISSDELKDLGEHERRFKIDMIPTAWSEVIAEINRNQNILHQMNYFDFERLVQQIFESYGWETELTSRTRDGGYDIIGIKRAEPTIFRVLIDAKRFHPDRKIGPDIVRSLYGVKQNKAASQLIIATSSFVTSDAKKEFARSIPWELSFYERDKILEWCRTFDVVTVKGTG